jgi:phage gpG-like protein
MPNVTTLGIGGASRGFGVFMFPSANFLQGALNSWSGEMRSFREPLNQSVREVVIPRVRDNFASESEAGNPWVPLAEATPFMPYRVAHGMEGRSDSILKVTGRLQRAVTSVGIWRFDGIGGMAFVSEIGSAPYAEVHQQGAVNRGLKGGLSNIPARPFLSVNQEDVDRMETIFQDWVSDSFGKTVGKGGTVEGRSMEGGF